MQDREVSSQESELRLKAEDKKQAVGTEFRISAQDEFCNQDH